MARSRNIKPGFFTNDDLADLAFEVRLLFIGLWTIADKEGRLADRPKKIKMEIFPADNVDCNAALDMLQSKGFIKRYRHGEVGYIQIVNWSKHQNPHVKEAHSVIPAPAPEIPVQAPEIPERAGLIPDSLNLIPDSLPPIPPEGVAAAKKKPSISLEGFESFWKIYPKQRAGSSDYARKAYGKALARGHPPWAILEGAKAYAASREVADGYAKGAAAWLNDDRFLNDYGDANGTDRQVNKPTKTDRINAVLDEAKRNIAAGVTGFAWAGPDGGNSHAMLSGPEPVREGAGAIGGGNPAVSNGSGGLSDWPD